MYTINVEVEEVVVEAPYSAEMLYETIIIIICTKSSTLRIIIASLMCTIQMLKRNFIFSVLP